MLNLDKFSVLISFYGKDLPIFLDAALKSISFDQILAPDQIVIVRDGPVSKELNSVVRNFIQRCPIDVAFVELEINVGLASALNIGLVYCRNEIVARMDADDLSDPSRFEIQLKAFLVGQYDVLGTGVVEIEPQTETIVGYKSMPLDEITFKKTLRIRNPLNHPTVMFRKSFVLAMGGYENIYPEDYLLWIRCYLSGGNLANLPDYLVKMRTGSNFFRRRGLKFFRGEVTAYRRLYAGGLNGFLPTMFFIFLRFALRASPGFFKSFVYKIRLMKNG